MGLFDKAKEAGDDLLDKVDEKAEELSEREGIVGKAAGLVDKGIDKIRGESEDSEDAEVVAEEE